MSPRSLEDNSKIRQETSTRILKSARKLFSLKGYHATSMADIAKEAGIAKGLTYHYFESKEALLITLAEQRLQQYLPLAEKLNSIEDPLERLEFFIEFAFKELQEKTEEMRFYNALYLTTEGVRAIEKALKKFKDQFEKLFQAEYKLQIDLGSTDPEMDATFLRSIIQGISLEYMLDPSFPLEKMKEKLFLSYSKMYQEKK